MSVTNLDPINDFFDVAHLGGKLEGGAHARDSVAGGPEAWPSKVSRNYAQSSWKHS